MATRNRSNPQRPRRHCHADRHPTSRSDRRRRTDPSHPGPVTADRRATGRHRRRTTSVRPSAPGGLNDPSPAVENVGSAPYPPIRRILPDRMSLRRSSGDARRRSGGPAAPPSVGPIADAFRTSSLSFRPRHIYLRSNQYCPADNSTRRARHASVSTDPLRASSCPVLRCISQAAFHHPQPRAHTMVTTGWATASSGIAPYRSEAGSRVRRTSSRRARNPAPIDRWTSNPAGSST